MAQSPLGPFDALRPLGKGGMGEVWLVRHRASGRLAAAKVLTAENLRNEPFERAFAAEARAVARLDHPGIIRLHDVGTVSAPAAEASEGRLVAGCPYLVMELADGGSLRSDPPRQTWPAVRDVLLHVLEALAHAHARGVIHRDIKPANVLWVTTPGSPSHPVLSDFGIAHAGDGGSRQGPTWGTPAYMAPERFTREWRDLGPWTDLYSVGCLAYALLRGRPPFKGEPLAQAMQAHLYRPVPAVRARFPVPAGVEDWLRTLLAKEPRDRFATAADAAWALQQLDQSGPMLPASPSSSPTGDDPTVPTDLLPDEDPDEALVDAFDTGGVSGVMDPRDRPQRRAGGRAEITWTDDTFDPGALTDAPSRTARSRRPHRRRPAERTIPPLPDDWREQGPRRAAPLPLGGGLRLFGLRVVRLVDREPERDRLWQALKTVRATETPAAVLLRGPLGTGKTRLAEWLAERASEVGGAIPLRADHAAGRTTMPLARMIADHLRCRGLGPRALRGRVHAWLQGRGVRDDWFARELAALAATGAGLPQERRGAGRGLPGELVEPADPRLVVRRFLALLARERPVVLHLDDIAWGPTSLSFLTELLERGGRLPVLAVLTTRDEVLDAHAAAGDALARLRDRGLLDELSVAPLPPRHRVELVRNLLGVERSLAEEVAERTGGNPLFTVALVRDWVARGVLAEGARGLELAADGPLPLPDDLHDVWRGRLDRIVRAAPRPDDARRALEIAAALGEGVDPDEWLRACRQQGLAAPEALVADLADALFAERLVDGGTDTDELRFAHGMIRESVERSAREADRWTAAHLACAAMIEERSPVLAPRERERLGRHLLAAAEEARAVPHLLAGVEHRLSRGDPAAGLVLLGDVESALQLLDDPDSTALRLQTWQLRARALADQGRVADARAWARRVLDRTAEQWRGEDGVREEGAGDEGAGTVEVSSGTARHEALVRARTLLVLGHVSTDAGELAEARAHLAEARRLLGEDAAFHDLAASQRLAGRLHLVADEVDAAEEALSEAAQLYGALQQPADRAECLVDLASAALARGEAAHADSLLSSAREAYRQARHRRGLADCMRVAAGVARARGDLHEAARCLRRAQTTYRRLGARQLVDCRLGRARIALELGDVPEARRLVDAVATRRGSTGDLAEPGLRAWITAARVALAARDQAWERCEQELSTLARLQLQVGTGSGEVRGLLELAATWAATAGEADRAARCRGLARRG